MTDEFIAERGVRYWNDPGADPADAELVAALASLGVDEVDRTAGVVDVGTVTATGCVAARRRRPISRSVLAVAAACALVVGAMLVATLVGGDDGVVIAAADGVTLVAADGSQRDGAVGTEIPDDVVVVVTGFVDVGDGPLGPGRYVVDDGELVPFNPLVASTSTTSDPPAGTDPLHDASARDVDDGGGATVPGTAAPNDPLPLDVSPNDSRPAAPPSDTVPNTSTDTSTDISSDPDQPDPLRPTRTTAPDVRPTVSAEPAPVRTTTAADAATTSPTTTPPTRPPAPTTTPTRPASTPPRPDTTAVPRPATTIIAATGTTASTSSTAPTRPSTTSTTSARRGDR